MDDIIKLRHELHQNPEVANKEFETNKRICEYFSKLNPDEEILLGKTGVAFIFYGKQPGETIVFRSELDALPIQEISDLPYQSINQKTAHVCGHDGHMATLAGFGKYVSENRPKKGKVVLLYQPAEEVEQGAKDIVENPKFEALNPDYIYAIHNIPGKSIHKVLVKAGSFAAASKGMTVKLTGKTSHAAEPEYGLNPADAISKIINKVHTLRANQELFSDLTLLTIIHILLGEIAFGTSPGYAEIRITLRAFENKDMTILTKKTEQIIKETAKEENLKCEINYTEVFPATVNHQDCINIITSSANELNLNVEQIEKPFKWSEDFSYYTEKYKGGYFGLGAGINQPPLHNPDYDYPDEIIETGIKLFTSIYKKHLL